MISTNMNVNITKRWFLKLTAIFSVLVVNNHAQKSVNQSIFIDDDIVIINGWVLLKSDLH